MNNNRYDKSIWELNKRMNKPECYNNQERHKRAQEQWRQLQLLQQQNVTNDEVIKRK